MTAITVAVILAVSLKDEFGTYGALVVGVMVVIGAEILASGKMR